MIRPPSTGSPMRALGWAAVLIGLPACVPATSTPPIDTADNVSAPASADGAATDPSHPDIQAWRAVEDLPGPLAQMETVFWEPDDTASLRRLIRETDLVHHRTVLEIGAGTGLVALCCLHAGAARVVATDINPQAIANAAFNAKSLGLADRLELRLVDPQTPGAYSTLADEERFDLILSNPPWENRRPESIAEFALYDEQFQLLHSLVTGLPDRLTPGGAAYFAYGCRDAIQTLHQVAQQQPGLHIETLDDRRLEALPEVFLPGMLFKVTLTEHSENKDPRHPAP